MSEPLTAEQRARKFVEREMPFITGEDMQNIWTSTLTKLILEAELDQMEKDRQMALKILGQVKS